MKKEKLNELWLKSLIGHLDVFNNRSSRVNRANLYYKNSEGEIDHNLSEWIKCSWTIEQFFCLLHRRRITHFIELYHKQSYSKIIAINDVPCSEEVTNITYNAKTINKIIEEIELYYNGNGYSDIYSDIASGVLTEVAEPIKWFEMAESKFFYILPSSIFFYFQKRYENYIRGVARKKWLKETKAENRKKLMKEECKKIQLENPNLS